ncbi:MAG: BrnT family toxin [Chitinivibrionales bacterium]|nr:BrnT family toxin [Chitinivibrionales bacterium]
MVEKLNWKHKVERFEVCEVMNGKPLIRYMEKGQREDEHVYAAFGQTATGRYLIVFYIYRKDKRALIISARTMTDKEKKYYVSKK